MNKPSDQQPGARPSTPDNRTQTNNPPSTDGKQYPRDTGSDTGQETADDASPNDEIKDPPEDDDAKAPLRAKTQNSDGASE